MPDWCLDRDKAGHYWLQADDQVARRAIIGEAGLVVADGKRESDMATPIGRWALRHLYFRQDLLGSVDTVIPASVITRHCGWCDDPAHQDYNCHVTLPFAGSHEVMWRDDGAYDLVVVLGFNDAPPIAGRGSAIFLHCIAADKTSTAGCVAVARDDLVSLLGLADAEQYLSIDRRLLS
jgi:L,D-peptidoglycan transpeptidase YkuD (ErfK/YbiS/YcfS/YnhG family)